MNSQMEKMTVKSMLLNWSQQLAEGRVRSEYLLEEMSLIGFVPYSVFWNDIFYDTGIDINDRLYVTPHFLRTSRATNPLPIFRSIAKAQGKKYTIDENFMIDSMVENIPDNVFKKEKYKECKQLFTGKLLKILLSTDRTLTKDLETQGFIEQSLESGSLTFVGRVGEWELFDGLGNFKCISNDFLCLCAYMNKVTGFPSYVVLSPDSTIRVLPEKENV